MLELENQEYYDEEAGSSTQQTKKPNSAKKNPKFIEQLTSFSPLVIISVVFGILFVAWLITMTIENMHSTVKQSENETDQSNQSIKTTDISDNNQLSTNSHNSGNSSNLSPLEESSNFNRKITDSNIETASFGNQPTNHPKTPSTDSPPFEKTHFRNSPPVRDPSRDPSRDSRIETAFEKTPKITGQNSPETMEDIKARQKRPIPKQLELEMQVHYENSQWGNIGHDLFQLEKAWNDNFHLLSQQLSSSVTSNNNFSIQTVKPLKPQIVETREILWSDVLDDILRMETMRAEMTDIFVQQIRPATEPTALSQLSDKFSQFDKISSWQQVAKQILAIEEYRAEMLETSKQALCCEK